MEVEKAGALCLEHVVVQADEVFVNGRVGLREHVVDVHAKAAKGHAGAVTGRFPAVKQVVHAFDKVRAVVEGVALDEHNDVVEGFVIIHDVMQIRVRFATDVWQG